MHSGRLKAQLNSARGNAPGKTPRYSYRPEKAA